VLFAQNAFKNHWTVNVAVSMQVAEPAVAVNVNFAIPVADAALIMIFKGTFIVEFAPTVIVPLAGIGVRVGSVCRTFTCIRYGALHSDGLTC
jgi:hypothetical protein